MNAWLLICVGLILFIFGASEKYDDYKTEQSERAASRYSVTDAGIFNDTVYITHTYDNGKVESFQYQFIDGQFVVVNHSVDNSRVDL